MKRSILGIIKLLRLKEYVYIVLITSILGVSSGQGEIGWRFLILLMANFLAVGFAFMVDDIENAPNDALSIREVNDNPISAGLITPKTAKYATMGVGILSVALYAYLGLWPLIFGLILLILGYLYSYRGIKLKSMVVSGAFLNSLMIAGLPYLCANFTYTPKLSQDGFWPFIFLMSLSLFITLYSKLHRSAVDRNARQARGWPVLSDRFSQIFVILILVIGVFSGAMTLFMIELIPSWVYSVIAILTLLFVIPAWLSIRKGEKIFGFRNLFLTPLTRASALALILQYLIPWLSQIWRP